MNHRSYKDSLYQQFARVGKAFASAKRLEMLDLLAQGERPVEAVARETELTIGNASAHLQVLRRARLVDSRKDGQQVYYRLADQDVFRLFRDLESLAKKRLTEVDQITRSYHESPEDLEGISAQELQARLRDNAVILLDVRPQTEYAAGHIPGALSVPPDELQQRLDEFPQNQEIIAYCRGPYCLYATDAVHQLRNAGYRARRLSLGLPDWRASGFPVARQKPVEAHLATTKTLPNTHHKEA